ncbi:MAG: exodeoxyribonuclease VII large subunit [Nitrospirota bacterium]
MNELFREDIYSAIHALTLVELTRLIKENLELAFPEALWVVAEISEIRCNAKGHCYLELVEREGEQTVAQIRANIWVYTFRSVASRFEKATGETLKQGMKVLLRVSVTFHEVYGLSLNIKDIDPTYSLGEMARKKREVIDRLTKEGLIRLNKEIPLPLVPQRIAVISSLTAAGYGDFINHLQNNPQDYKVFHRLYQSLMQGQEAEASIVSSLRQIRAHRDRYDAVVIIRGGGSQIDLSCFDTYGLAVDVARFPLPVITGIGHERDDTVVDMVAHTKMNTPTAVAEFLLSGMSSFEERLVRAERTIMDRSRALLMEEHHRIQYLIQKVRHMVGARFGDEMKRIEISLHRLMHETTQNIDRNNNRLGLAVNSIVTGIRMLFLQQENRIKHFDHAVGLLDPINVLKRGYSITYFKGKAIKDTEDLHEGDIIETKVCKGTFRSRVEAFDGKE